MRIFRSLEEVPTDLGPAIVTVGNFDGVHCGHRHVLREVVQRAHTTGSTSVVLTFDPHPLRILRPDIALSAIQHPFRRDDANLAGGRLSARLKISIWLWEIHVSV